MTDNLEQYIGEMGYNFIILDQSRCDLPCQEDQVQTVLCETQGDQVQAVLSQTQQMQKKVQVIAISNKLLSQTHVPVYLSHYNFKFI